MIITPEVNPQPVPGVRVQSAADETTFGGGPGALQTGMELQKIAQETGDIGAFEKIRADQTATEGARAQMSATLVDKLYNPQTGILKSKGLDALKAGQEGINDLKKNFNDIVEGLNGQAQKGAASKMAIDMVDNAQTHIMAHTDNELTLYHHDAMDSTVKNQSAIAAMGHGDQKTIDSASANVKDATEAFIVSQRLDKQSADLLREKNSDIFHSSVIDGLTKFQNDDSAQKYFDANKENITPDTQKKIAEALQEHGTRWKAANAAQSVLDKNHDSEADALSDLDKVKNPEVQDAARKLVASRLSEDRAAKKNDQEDLFTRMSQMVNDKGLTDPYDRRMAVPPMAWNRLSSEQQRAIEKGGNVDQTSISKWEDFTQAVKDGSLAKMTRAEINTKFIPYMTPADQKTVADYWSGIKKPGGGPKEKSYQSVLQMQDDALVGIGALSPKNPTKDQLVFKKQFSDAVDRDLTVQQNSLGRPLKEDEIQSVVDKHTLNAISQQPEGWFPSVSYDVIPDRDKQHIIEMARGVGVTATKSHIEEAYKLHRQGKSDADIAKALR